LQDRHAIEQVFVDARPSAIDAREGGARRRCDARRECHQRDETAAVEWQADDRGVGDDLSEAARFRAQRGRLAGHVDGFFEAADGERDVEAEAFTGGECDRVLDEALESVQFDREGVDARRQRRQRVKAFVAGDDDARIVGAQRANRHVGARQPRPVGSRDPSGQLGATCLREEWRGPRGQHPRAPAATPRGTTGSSSVYLQKYSGRRVSYITLYSCGYTARAGIAGIGAAIAGLVLHRRLMLVSQERTASDETEFLGNSRKR
jgi:hypothetical protein